MRCLVAGLPLCCRGRMRPLSVHIQDIAKVILKETEEITGYVHQPPRLNTTLIVVSTSTGSPFNMYGL